MNNLIQNLVLKEICIYEQKTRFFSFAYFFICTMYRQRVDIYIIKKVHYP